VALHPCKECKAQISTDAKVCPHCGKKQGSSTGCLSIVIVVFILLAIGRLATVKPGPHGDSGGETVSAPVDPKEVALSQVKLTFTWSKDEDIDVMYATFVVTNDSNYDVKDLEITCQHFAPSGTNIDSNTRTIYEIVTSHSTRKFPHFDMGFIHSQAVRSSCKVADLTVVQ
jgi:hypothetical protein